MPKFKTITQKITALSVTIIVSLLGLVIASNYINQGRTIDTMEHSRQESLNSVFWDQIDKDAASLQKLLSVMAMNETLVDVFLQQDKDLLLEKASPLFNEIREKYDITHFYFIEKSGDVFLRVHNPPKAGDNLKRATFLEAQRTGSVASGIEMGKSYFSLRVVMPVRINNEVVGYFELGEELDHFVEGFRKVTNADVSLWLSSDYASRKKLTDKFENVSGWYRLMASDESQQNELLSIGAADISTDSISQFNVSHNAKALSVQATPFKDAFGETAGVVLIANDITSVEDAFSDTMLSVFAVSSAFLVIFVLIAVKLSRSITHPIRMTNRMLENITSVGGDLSHRLEVHGQDEMAEMATKFNRFVDQLHSTISQVSSASSSVCASSDTMETLSKEGSEAVREQRFEIDQVTSAITEMSASAQEVSTRAVGAADSAETADKDTLRGQKIVQKMVNSIEKLSHEMEDSVAVITNLTSESQNIGGVLSVIKGIAEQTNLLALNAAIEAARAGEQGRGFAVVADEVRTLAQRTQESTLEIEKMIESLQGKAKDAEASISASRDMVQSTVEDTNVANEALSAITQSVASIKDMNTQIATAAEQQSSVAEEINRNINNIHSISERNDEYALKMKDSCTGLATMGDELNQTISRFKL